MSRIELQRTAPGTASRYAELESPSVQVIKPVKRRLRLADIARGTQVIRVIATRDFKVKYKQSLLGPLWLVFQPLALLAAFFVAFRNLANVQPGVPYSVFVLVGLTVWSFFQASMTIGTASLISSATLVRFTPCPRFAFPIAGVLASIPTFAVTALGAVGAAAVTGTLSPRAVLLPLTLVWLMLLCFGVVAITSAVTVRYRDLLQAMPFLLQIGVFVAPVGYPLYQLGPVIRQLVELNPLTGLIEASRWMVVSGYHAATGPVLFSGAATMVLAVVGWRVFTHLETTMADEI
jgi:lipopolysaccharide transport system permease protein